MAVKMFFDAKAYPSFKAPQKDLVAGRVVVAGTDGVVDYPADATIGGIKGIIAQNVIAPNVNTHILPSINNVARYGEVVGVYIQPGTIIETDQIVDNVAIGDVLYAAEGADAGKLTKTDPNTGTGTPIAKALTAGNAGTFVRIMLL
jgi:hypothetical protein